MFGRSHCGTGASPISSSIVFVGAQVKKYSDDRMYCLQICLGTNANHHIHYCLSQMAKLYYTSLSLGCWDEIGMHGYHLGSVPTCCHPKPRPTTSRYLLDSLQFLYQKQMYIHFQKFICWDFVGMTIQTMINNWKSESVF